MAQGFYEILGVDGTSKGEDIAKAYHIRLAELVRRLRAARKQGADVSILEGQERILREAMQVVSDPVRRQRYDAYRRACVDGMPEDAEALWELARTSLVDPVAVAAVEVLRTSTSLDVGNPFPDAPKPRRWLARAPVPLPPSSAAPPSVEEVPPAPAPATVQPLPPPPHVAESLPLLSPEEVGSTEPLPPAPPPSLDDIPAILDRFGPDGRFIRTVRELRRMELQDMATETRISQRYLNAIEGNDFDSLPAATFVRGYVKEIARALDLADLGLVEGYMGLFTHHRG